MRGKNQRLHQEGMGSRTASHAVHTPPIHPLFSLFSCPYKISQQSHKGPPRRPSATLAPTVWAILSLKTLLLKEILGAG